MERYGSMVGLDAKMRAVLQAKMMCTYRHVFKVEMGVFEYAEYDGNIRFVAPSKNIKI